VYLLLRRRLIRFFSGRNCEDPDGLADDTVARVLEAFSKRGGDIRDLTKFAHGIAHNIYVDLVRSHGRHEPRVEAVLSFPADQPEPRALCLERCLRRLPREK